MTEARRGRVSGGDVKLVGRMGVIPLSILVGGGMAGETGVNILTMGK